MPGYQGKTAWKWGALKATANSWKDHHKSVFEKHGKGLSEEDTDECHEFAGHSKGISCLCPH